MKSQVFDIKRFGKLFGTELALNFKTNWISLMITLLIEVIVMITVSTMSLVTVGKWAGSGEISRGLSFVVFLALLVLIFPYKFYRTVNDTESGPAYLMLPASRFEKFLSMVLNTAVVLPAVSLGIFLGIDALICLIPNSGPHILQLAKLPDMSFILKGGDGTRLSPALFIDGLVCWILVFLLGTIWFKGAKVPKTILAYFVISSFFGMLTLCIGAIFGPIRDLSNLESFKWFFEHLSLVDTICTQALIIILLIVLWFRLKNLKL